MSGRAHSSGGQKVATTGPDSEARYDALDIEGFQDGWQQFIDRSDASLSYDAIHSASRRDRMMREIEGHIRRGPTLMSALILYFESDQWNYHLLEDHQTIVLAFQGNNGEWNCIAQVRAEQEQIVFYSTHEEAVPEARRDAVSELATRINYQLVLGAFEFDLEDGELNFRTALDCDGVLPEPRLVRNVIQTNLVTMDRYLPAIRAVIDGADPARILAHLDSQD